MLLSLKTDIETLVSSSKQFKASLAICEGYFSENCMETEDMMVMEGILYYLDYYRYLINFPKMQRHLKDVNVILKFF